MNLPENRQSGTVIYICPGENFSVKTAAMPTNVNMHKHLELSNKMRLAWSQHVYWTRLLLISIAERLKDESATAARILRNPGDIAAIYREYYSEGDANKIAQLLTEHLQTGAQLITALRDGKSEEAFRLNHQWYANADKMAEAFSAINPHYGRESLGKMLYKHLDLTTNEVSMRLKGNYAADIEAFDKVEEEAMMMADYFTAGIMQMFPQKFE